MESSRQLKLIISLLFLLQITVGCKGQACEVKSSCECVYENGMGYDLSHAMGTKDFMEIVPTLDTRILFSPCLNSKNFSEDFNKLNATQNECLSGYTLCFLDIQTSRAYLLGSTANTTFALENDEVYLKFGTASKVSTVELQCTPNGKESILYAPPATKLDAVKLTFFSKSACLDQLEEIVTHGFFYTFFITALILLFLYLALGILYNYFLVGARGFELIPNYDFWTRLWSSIKLGFIFVKNGCRVLPTEDSYDAI